MKRKTVINHQAQQLAQEQALNAIHEAISDGVDHAQVQAHCTQLLADRLEEIQDAVGRLWSLNAGGELNSEDWHLVTQFFDRIAAAAPGLHFPVSTMKVDAA